MQICSDWYKSAQILNLSEWNEPDVSPSLTVAHLENGDSGWHGRKRFGLGESLVQLAANMVFWNFLFCVQVAGTEWQDLESFSQSPCTLLDCLMHCRNSFSMVHNWLCHLPFIWQLMLLVARHWLQALISGKSRKSTGVVWPGLRVPSLSSLPTTRWHCLLLPNPPCTPPIFCRNRASARHQVGLY